MFSVLIANECLDNRLTSRIPGVMWKLDLEKSYDDVNWEFLSYLLGRLDFDFKWRKWMFSSISTTWFSIWINGRLYGFFGSSRSLRQGNPLSPLLFVIVKEILSRMLSRAMVRGYLSGFWVYLQNTAPWEISHFLFANDTLIIFFLISNNLVLLKAPGAP
jgi:hypothetical protein